MLIKNCLYVFGMSMLPIVELRGGIILGASLDLPMWLNFIVCVIGNMLPVPFILLFVRAVLSWMKKSNIKFFQRIAEWMFKKAEKNTEKVQKYETLGLFIFVAIPLPATGAWTGALVAAMLNMRLKYAIMGILGGVLVAAAIMTGIAYGFLGFLSWLALV